MFNTYDKAIDSDGINWTN